jgi:hypothetical protein
MFPIPCIPILSGFISGFFSRGGIAANFRGGTHTLQNREANFQGRGTKAPPGPPYKCKNINSQLLSYDFLLKNDNATIFPSHIQNCVH